MKIREWLENSGLTIDDEMPEKVSCSLKDIPKDILDGLSEESVKVLRSLALDTNDIDSVKKMAEWLRHGDVGLYNTGQTVLDALSKIEKESSAVRKSLGLEPVQPMEYISFKYNFVDFAVIVRFRAIES